MNIRELAAIAGLSKSTVAYALKDDARIQAETRKRVQALAKQHGYQPSPTVNAFMNEVRKGTVRKNTVSIACLMGGHHNEFNKRLQYEQITLEAAEAQARDLGYGFEVFYWEADGISENRLQSILMARGIKGIYLGTGHTNNQRLKLDWSRFSIVASGYSIRYPEVDRFAADLHKSMAESIQLALKRGYTKVVVALHDPTDQRVGRRWLSGATTTQEIQGRDRVIIARRDWMKAKPSDLQKLIDQPKCAVISHSMVYTKLLELGTHIPQPVGFVALDTFRLPEHVTASVQPHQELGREAILRLAFLIEHGMRGEPANSMRLTLSCGWREGATLSPVH